MPTKMTKGKEQWNLEVNRSTKARFKALARRQGLPVNSLLEDAMELVLDGAPGTRPLRQRPDPGTAITVPLKYFGGKQDLAKKLLPFVPPHRVYVEPYFGGGGFFWTKPPSEVEYLNDIDSHLMDFVLALQDERTFWEVYRRSRITPFARAAWQRACALVGDPRLDVHAWAYLVRNRLSHSGRNSEFAAFTRARSRNGQCEQASAWESTTLALPSAHLRVFGCYITKEDALKIIRRHNSNFSFLFLDPPYPEVVRVCPDVYDHEADDCHHEKLLRLITARGFRSRVMICSYDNDLYRERLAGWHRLMFDVPVQASNLRVRRRAQEVVWLNFDPRQLPGGLP